MDSSDLAEQRQRDAQRFEQVKEAISKKLPNHSVKEFAFDRFEQQLLAEQQTIIALANGTQDKIINEICLKRLGIAPNPQVHIRYAVGLGKLAVYLPQKKTP